MPRVVTTVIVGAGVMMIGEEGVAALSTRGRVFEAMTGGTELYRVTNTYTVGNMIFLSFYFIGKFFLLNLMICRSSPYNEKCHCDNVTGATESINVTFALMTYLKRK